MALNFQIAAVAAALSPDPRTAASLARQIDVDGLQFDADGSFDFAALSVTGRGDFLRMLSQQNQQLASLRSGSGRVSDLDKLLWKWDRVLSTAAGLKTPLVCLDIGPLPKEPQALLSELGGVADRYGLTVALRSDLDSLAALEAGVRAANCPWFGFDLDPAALLSDAWSAEEAISRLGPIIRHVRARDALLGSEHRTRPATIGNGSVAWPNLLRLLDEAGYHGWLTVDPMELADRRRAATAGAEFLRQLLI